MVEESVLNFLYPKGGGYRKVKRHRVTKGQLGKIWRKGGNQVSPEIGTEVVESGDTVELNVIYSILNVEEVTTEVSFYQGIRVEMIGTAGQLGSIMLWRRSKVGKGSKLGSFIELLGSNTDTWKGKFIVFEKWEKNNRKILPAQLPKLAQAAVEAGAELAPLRAPKKSAKK
jgi:hypothetical protein